MKATPPTPCPVGLIRRLATIVYETLLLGGVLVVASVPVTVPLDITPTHPLFLLFIAYVYGVSFFYLGWFWVQGRQSLAMRAWEIRVERLDGTPLGWRDAAVRYAGALPYWGLIVLAWQSQQNGAIVVAAALWAALGIALTMTAIDPQKRMLQDYLSRTRLVRAERDSAQTAECDETQGEKDQ